MDKFELKIDAAQKAFAFWRTVPAPKRGELIRTFGNILRKNKDDLARNIVNDSKKIWVEALGEVQEAIDMCDFAVGLSRQVGGLTLPSERPNHSMQERWHPLGVVGVISAFNFPVAVWAWNFCLAIICGNAVVWKPSEKGESCAAKCQDLWIKTVSEYGFHGHVDNLEQDVLIKDLMQVIYGGREAAIAIADDPRFSLVSATGSCEMGKNIGQRVARRLGKCLLELGGNNAAIISDKADIDLAVRSCVFAAVGTAGQRCTSLRRALVHEKVYDEFVTKMKAAYDSIKIGDPMIPGSLVGPVIDKNAYHRINTVVQTLKKDDVQVFGGELRELALKGPKGEVEEYYVKPAIAELETDHPLMYQETFGPILYVMKYKTLSDAIKMQNSVSQGLSSCIFTKDMQEAETFISAVGSDCGIANINTSTSGAEIGGAFGGEKDTGGGRESGSDAWKNYMRRQTITINYGNELPLAQGIKFDLT